MTWPSTLIEVATWAGVGAVLVLLVLIALVVGRIRAAEANIADARDQIVGRLDRIDRRLDSLRPTEVFSRSWLPDPSPNPNIEATPRTERVSIPVQPLVPVPEDPAMGLDSGEVEAPESEPPSALDESLASEVFRKWCADRESGLPTSVNATAMSIRVSQGGSELRSPTIRFVERDQIGDFVKLTSNATPDEGYLFPHPDAAFNPGAHPRVFDLTAESFKNFQASLAGVDPIWVRRTGASEWEIA